MIFRRPIISGQAIADRCTKQEFMTELFDDYFGTGPGLDDELAFAVVVDVFVDTWVLSMHQYNGSSK